MNVARLPGDAHEGEPALSESFIDWWFNPWACAGDLEDAEGISATLQSLTASDTLARRDAYRLWCAELKVVPDLPQRFDPAWSFAADTRSAKFDDALRLFGAVIAACERDHTQMGELQFDDRRWCMSIASIQPLASVAHGAGSLAERGALELKARLEAGFHGLWSRLRLMLPPGLRATLDMPAVEDTPIQFSPAAVTRAQRCWRLCCERTGASN